MAATGEYKCAPCGRRFHSHISDQDVALFVFERSTDRISQRPCPRCGAISALLPELLEMVELISSPSRSAQDRAALISVLRSRVNSPNLDRIDDELADRVPAFRILGSLLRGMSRSDVIALASLAVSVASLTNDLQDNKPSPAVVTDQSPGSETGAHNAVEPHDANVVVTSPGNRAIGDHLTGN